SPLPCHSGRAKREPESIIPGCGYGFRVRRVAAPGNDKQLDARIGGHDGSPGLLKLPAPLGNGAHVHAALRHYLAPHTFPWRGRRGAESMQQARKVVIAGAGFGGIEAAKALARAPVEVTLVDRQNHHCFQPLLYQVATAALSPADVAWPIRHILQGQGNVTVLMTPVTGVDKAARQLITEAGPIA